MKCEDIEHLESDKFVSVLQHTTFDKFFSNLIKNQSNPKKILTFIFIYYDNLCYLYIPIMY